MLFRSVPYTCKRNGKDVKVQGYFGPVSAVSYAVEEQGRKTLHVHMTLWIDEFKDVQSKFFFGGLVAKKKAEAMIKRYAEHVGSTSLFPEDSKDQIKAFDHDCKVPKSKRKPPMTLNDQHLRNMRNKRWYKESGGTFAMCPHCQHTWTYEDLMVDYLEKYENIQCQVTSPSSDDADAFKSATFKEHHPLKRPESTMRIRLSLLLMRHDSPKRGRSYQLLE